MISFPSIMMPAQLLKQEENKYMRKRIAELEAANGTLADNNHVLKIGFHELRAKVVELEAELDKYRWISVKDRLPKKYGVYLTKYKGDGRQRLLDEIHIRSYPFNEFVKDLWSGKKKSKSSVTHWMEIPEIPKG